MTSTYSKLIVDVKCFFPDGTPVPSSPQEIADLLYELATEGENTESDDSKEGGDNNAK